MLKPKRGVAGQNFQAGEEPQLLGRRCQLYGRFKIALRTEHGDHPKIGRHVFRRLWTLDLGVEQVEIAIETGERHQVLRRVGGHSKELDGSLGLSLRDCLSRSRNGNAPDQRNHLSPDFRTRLQRVNPQDLEVSAPALQLV